MMGCTMMRVGSSRVKEVWGCGRVGVGWCGLSRRFTTGFHVTCHATTCHHWFPRHLPRDNFARVQVTMPTYFVPAAYSVSPCHARGGIRDQRHIQLVQKSLTQKSILKSWHRHSHLFAWPLTRRQAAISCGTCVTLTGGTRCSCMPRRDCP